MNLEVENEPRKPNLFKGLANGSESSARAFLSLPSFLLSLDIGGTLRRIRVWLTESG